MPRQIEHIEQLKAHLDAVMDRSAHHATSVRNTVLIMAGLIVWRSVGIEGRTHEGHPANNVWFYTESGKRYAVAYSHDTGSVEIREYSQQGKTMHTFNDEGNVDELIDFFRNIE